MNGFAAYRRRTFLCYCANVSFALMQICIICWVFNIDKNVSRYFEILHSSMLKTYETFSYRFSLLETLSAYYNTLPHTCGTIIHSTKICKFFCFEFVHESGMWNAYFVNRSIDDVGELLVLFEKYTKKPNEMKRKNAHKSGFWVIKYRWWWCSPMCVYVHVMLAWFIDLHICKDWMCHTVDISPIRSAIRKLLSWIQVANECNRLECVQ